MSFNEGCFPQLQQQILFHEDEINNRCSLKTEKWVQWRKGWRYERVRDINTWESRCTNDCV